MKFFTLAPLIIAIEVFYGMGITARTTPPSATVHSAQPVSFLALLSQQSSRLLAQAIDASPEAVSAPTNTSDGTDQSPVVQATEPAVADPASSDASTIPVDATPGDTAASDLTAQIPIVPDTSATPSDDASPTAPAGIDTASPDAAIPALPVSQEAVATAQQETAAVENAPSAVEKDDLIVAFADHKVSEIATLTQKSDYSTANYVLQQLSDQVTALATAQPAVQNTPLAEKIQAFKKEADSSLRTAQLTLPENQEQDAEIIRGKLLAL